jgi:hypothetical protein
MTQQEHNLIFSMFAFQEVKIRSLIDALKSSGAVSDLEQFDAFAHKDELKRKAIVEELAGLYRGLAANQKLDVQLDIS